MRFQLFAARLAFAGFLLAALTAIAAVAGTRLGYWAYDLGYRLMIPAVVLGLIGAAAGLAWIVTALRRNVSMGFRLGVIGLAGSLLVIFPPLQEFYRLHSLPPLHDITTDPEHPPAFVALLPLRKGARNSTAYDGNARVTFDGRTQTIVYMQHKYYPDIVKPMVGIRPDAAKGTPVAQYFWHAFEAAKKTDWTIIAFDPKSLRIEATDRSLWFGRAYDIVIRIKPAGILGARMDIRSESRDGIADAGANARRIKAYLHKFGPP
jgi:hypothetical protein